MEELKPEDKERIVSKNKNFSNLTALSGETAASDFCIKGLDWTQEITQAHSNVLNLANVFKPQKAQEVYDLLSPDYEGLYNRLGYSDPKKIAEMAFK
jgi:hypothetical protein